MFQIIKDTITYTAAVVACVAVALFSGTGTVSAQELNCQVEFNTDQIQGTNKTVFETLKESVTEYMNTTHFTNAQFSPVEKIECRMFFTIKEVDGDTYKGDLQVQSTHFRTETDCMLSFVVMTGLTINLMPSRKVIKTEKFPIAAGGTRLAM